MRAEDDTGGFGMIERIKGWLSWEAGNWLESLRSMRALRVQTLTAMLLALTVVLDYVGGFYLTATVKITPSFLGHAVTGALLGPFPAMLNGALADVLMWLIKPAGAYFPGYTLSGLLGGLLYGVALYRRRGKQLYIGAAAGKLAVNALINVALNTYWSSIFVGKAYLALLPARALKNMIAWPIESILLILVLLALEKSGIYQRLGIPGKVSDKSANTRRN